VAVFSSPPFLFLEVVVDVWALGLVRALRLETGAATAEAADD